MSDVSKITKSLQNLRVQSESKRASRATARNRPNERGASQAIARSGGSTPQTQKGISLRGKLAQTKRQQPSAGPQRGNTASGQVRTLAKKLTSFSTIKSNILAFHDKVRAAGSLAGLSPFKASVEHDGIPVVSSIAHDKSRLWPELSTRAVDTKYGPGIEITGEEYLFSAATSSNTYAMGNSIVAFPLNPRVLTTPRLSLFSKLYTRFLFKEVELCYEHSAGAMNNGSLCLFGVYDATVNPMMRPGDPLIAYATNRRAAQSGVFEDVKVRMDDSHFADMLFLQTDEDLRWTLQGTMYAASVGSIAPNLEMGQLKLRYKVVMANDDLDEDEILPVRSYSTQILTSALGVIGNSVQFNTSGIPAGKYYASVRADPTSGALTVWKDRDAFEQNDINNQSPIVKGCGFYLTVPNSGTAISFHAPDLFTESGRLNGREMLYANTAPSGTTVPVQLLRLSD